MRKGMIASQTFIYIAGAILVVLILILGIKAIMGFKARQYDAAVLQLEAEIKSAVDSVADDFGSVREVGVRLPSGIDKVCFVDTSQRTYLLQTSLVSKYPAIYESVLAEENKNLFLMKNDKVLESRYIGRICLDRPFYKCIDTPQGLLKMLVQGKKGCVNIIKPLSTLKIVNVKNSSRYDTDPIFMTADSDDWEDKEGILSIIPIAVSSLYEGKLDAHPYYVYYEQGTQPQDEFMVDYLLSKHSSSEIRFILKAGESVPPQIAGLPSVTGETLQDNYFTYWSYLEDVVLIDTQENHPGAVVAALFSAYLSAPLIHIDDTTLVFYQSFLAGKRTYVVDNLDSGVNDYINVNAKEVVDYSHENLRDDSELNPYRELMSEVLPSVFV